MSNHSYTDIQNVYHPPANRQKVDKMSEDEVPIDEMPCCPIFYIVINFLNLFYEWLEWASNYSVFQV
jgi:hypothetical protein